MTGEREQLPDLPEQGGYIGPVERDEALAAIRSHMTGPVVILYPERGVLGGKWKLAAGWQRELGGVVGLPEDAIGVDPDAPLEPVEKPLEDPPGSGAFAFGRGDAIPLATGTAFAGAFVLDLSGAGWTAERYTDGLDLRFRDDCIVRFVFWHEVLYETPSGDLAPGFGGFSIEGLDPEGDG